MKPFFLGIWNEFAQTVTNPHGAAFKKLQIISKTKSEIFNSNEILLSSKKLIKQPFYTTIYQKNQLENSPVLSLKSQQQSKPVSLLSSPHPRKRSTIITNPHIVSFNNNFFRKKK